MMRKTVFIVVAAGSGSRFGGELPKQFCRLGDRPVVCHAVDRLRESGGEVILVVSPGRIEWWKEWCRENSYHSPQIVAGGATRWESVRNAIRAIDAADAADVDLIGVHDGARPLVDREVVGRLISQQADGAIPVVGVVDSIRRIVDGGSRAEERATLRAVHTPQVFDAAKLRRAYELPYSPAFTDDASVMEAAGFSDLALVDDTPANIKITHPGDLVLAAYYLEKGF